jgi:single-stranded-DNA-specific exonuclease
LAEPAKTMGSGDRHFTVRFTQHGTTMRAVAFGQADWVEPFNTHPGLFDVAFRPSINEYNGFQKVELQLMDWRVAKLSANAPHASAASPRPISAS